MPTLPEPWLQVLMTDAHQGPRLAVRTAEDFLAWVHPNDGSPCPTHVGETKFCHCADRTYPLEPGVAIRRFTYLGPIWAVQ